MKFQEKYSNMSKVYQQSGSGVLHQCLRLRTLSVIVTLFSIIGLIFVIELSHHGNFNRDQINLKVILEFYQNSKEVGHVSWKTATGGEAKIGYVNTSRSPEVLTIQTTLTTEQVWPPEDAASMLPKRTVRRNFEGFDNETGSDELVIPNIVHFVRFGTKPITFVHALVMKSAFINQRPDTIMIHSDSGLPRGKYWNWLCTIPGFRDIVQLKNRTLPTHVYGQELNKKWRPWHGSDLTRILVLMEYGGIYLDNDVMVINSLDKWRHYEFSFGWTETPYIGSMILIAHKDARFLPIYFGGYKEYYGLDWYMNAGAIPTKRLEKHPGYARGEWDLFGTSFHHELYNTSHWDEWRNLNAIHLNINWRTKEDLAVVKEFNETNIMTYNRTWGEMARTIYLAEP